MISDERLRELVATSFGSGCGGYADAFRFARAVEREAIENAAVKVKTLSTIVHRDVAAAAIRALISPP